MATMQMIPVSSSQLATVGYDADEQVLAVTFNRSEQMYYYPGVSQAEFDALVGAESIGKHYNMHIKGRAFTKEAPTTRKPEPEPIQAVQQEAEVLVDERVEAQPSIEEAEEESTGIVQMARGFVVQTRDDQEFAGGVLIDIKRMREKVQALFAPQKEQAHKLHKTICAQENTLLAPLADAERSLKAQIGNYTIRQQQLARAEEQRQREIAMKEAQERARKEDEERRLQAAIELEAQGMKDDAAAVLEFANPAPIRYTAPAPVVAEVARVQGVSTRTTWKFRVIDPDRIPREYLMVDEKAIGERVRRTNGRIRISGIEIFEDTIVSANTSRRGA